MGGQEGCGYVEHSVHLLFGLAHTQTTNSIAWKPKARQEPSTLLAQVSENAPLYNAKEGLVAASLRRLAALSPGVGARQSLLVVGSIARLGAFVQDHDYVRSQLLLHADHHLGAEKVARAIYVGAKLDTILGDLALSGQAEHLEATRIGQDGAIPAHKAVQSAHLGHQVRSGTQIEVIGIAQDQLDPQFSKIPRIEGLDCRLGANRGKSRGRDLAVGGVDASQASTASGVSLQQRK